jgi:TolB protein
MKPIWWLLMLLTILLFIASAIFWFGSPRLESYTPAQAALDVPPAASLRLTFSTHMQEQSVFERLSIEPAITGEYTWEGATLVFTPEQPWPAGATLQVSLAPGARSAGWLPLTTRQGYTWSFTVRLPTLLYLYPADQAANLYQVDLRTQQSKQLTNFSAGLLEFDAAPDGSAIYYSIVNSLGGSDLYRLEPGADASNPQASLVLACQQAQCRAPRIAPQQDYLAYERIEPPGSDQPVYPRIWLVNLAGSPGSSAAQPAMVESEPQLAGDPLHQTIQPDWSANGILSFYDTNQQAFIVLDPRSGQGTSLPNQTGEPGSWSPSGRVYIAPEIYFNAGGNPQTTPELKPIASSHLLRYNIEDGAIQDLTGTENLEDATPAFSPDGLWLAFARKYLEISRWTPGRQLWVMRADGSQARQLTDQPDFNHYDFTWDPAGGQLAFVRFDQTAPTNLPAIWLYDVEREFEIEIVRGGYAPHWIP